MGGSKTYELTAHPTAHTDNDLTVLDKKDTKLYGCQIYYSLEHLPVIDGSLKGWLKELKQHGEKSSYQLVIPGHGPVSNRLAR